MITILLVLFLVSWILLRKFLKSDEADKHLERIPGPKGLPLFGNVGDLFCKDEERWRRMRARGNEYYPIYKMKVGSQTSVSLLDPVDVEVILGNPKYQSKGIIYEHIRYWLGNGLIFSSGETWRKSRKIFTSSFHFSPLKNYVNSMNNATAYLNDLLKTEIEKPVETSHFFNFQSFKVICESLLGKGINIEDKSAHSFIKSIKEMTYITTLKMLVPLMNILYKYTNIKKTEDVYLKIYNDFISDVIEESSRNIDNEDQPRFMNSLIKNYEGKGLRDELSSFLFAGQDTTSIAMNFFLYILGNKPQFQEEIYNEIVHTCVNASPTYAEIQQMNFFARFIKECFRLYPTAYFIGRTIDENVELPSGYTIPAGTNVFIQIFDIHRSSRIYPNPEIFDPDRFLPENVQKRHPFSFIPFSAGPRNCIAQKFALLEIKTTLCGILRKYRIESVGSLDDIVLIPDLLLKSKSPLKVKFIPREITQF